MKICLTIVSFFVFASNIVFAQQEGFNAGVLAGVNASQVSGDSYSGFNKAGILLGLYTNIDVSQTLNLQFEINYSEKGSRRNPNTDEGDTDFFLLRMNYIEIPVMARMRKRNFTFEGGIFYGVKVYDYLEDENGEFEIPPQLNQFKRSDIGVLLGLNFNFTDNLIMNWRINSSVLPFRDYDSGGSFQFDSGMYHHYLSFTFRYEFLGSNDG